MSTKSVIDASQRILAGMMGGGQKPTAPSPAPMSKMPAPDVRNIKVSEDQVAKIIAESFGSKPEVQEEPEVTNESADEKVTKLNDLVQKLAKLVVEAKGIIQEMTTCGMLGTNQKFVLNDKKKKKNATSKLSKRK